MRAASTLPSPCCTRGAKEKNDPEQRSPQLHTSAFLASYLELMKMTCRGEVSTVRVGRRMGWWQQRAMRCKHAFGAQQLGYRRRSTRKREIGPRAPCRRACPAACWRCCSGRAWSSLGGRGREVGSVAVGELHSGRWPIRHRLQAGAAAAATIEASTEWRGVTAAPASTVPPGPAHQSRRF